MKNEKTQTKNKNKKKKKERRKNKKKEYWADSTGKRKIWEDEMEHKLKASLGCTVKLCLETEKKGEERQGERGERGEGEGGVRTEQHNAERQTQRIILLGTEPRTSAQPTQAFHQ